MFPMKNLMPKNHTIFSKIKFIYSKEPLWKQWHITSTSLKAIDGTDIPYHDKILENNKKQEEQNNQVCTNLV